MHDTDLDGEHPWEYSGQRKKWGSFSAQIWSSLWNSKEFLTFTEARDSLKYQSMLGLLFRQQVLDPWLVNKQPNGQEVSCQDRISQTNFQIGYSKSPSPITALFITPSCSARRKRSKNLRSLVPSLRRQIMVIFAAFALAQKVDIARKVSFLPCGWVGKRINNGSPSRDEMGRGEQEKQC